MEYFSRDKAFVSLPYTWLHGKSVELQLAQFLWPTRNAIAIISLTLKLIRFLCEIDIGHFLHPGTFDVNHTVIVISRLIYMLSKFQDEKSTWT